METRFNKKMKRRRLLLSVNWQERLPLRTVAVLLGMLLVVLLAILVNQPADSYLNNAEIDVLRRTGSLRVGIDENLYGLHQNGQGLEPALCAALAEEIFGSLDGCQTQLLTRQTVAWQMSEGNIDLAIMSLPSLSGKVYLATDTPFYTDPCLLMGYEIPPREALGDKRVAVLYHSPAYDVLCQYQQDEENGLVIVTYAAYYDMMVALRAGTVEAVCMPRTAALTYRERGMALSGYSLGTIDYHIIGTSEEKELMALIDSLLLRWARDGTLRSLYESSDLLYELNG